MHSSARQRLRDTFSQPGLALQLGALLIGLVLLGLAMDLRQAPPGFVVEWDMARNTGGPVQVFPGGPTGYSADNVLEVAAESDGSMHVHRAEFEGELPARIRIDPGAAQGWIEIRSIRVHGGGRTLRLEGPALAGNVRLLNDLTGEPSNGTTLRLRSTGTDPYLDFPSLAPGIDGLFRMAAIAVLAGLGLLFVAWTAWHRRHAVAAGWRSLGPGARAILAIIAACALAYALMSAAGLGCTRMACSPRGWAFAAPLFSACLGFLVVGTALLEVLGLGRGQARPLFLPVLAGQVALVVYIYARSLLTSAFPALPVTRAELWMVVAGCGLVLWRRGWRPIPAHGERAWLLMRLALLALACLVVADRELPRIAMLSSDPDTHAFFALQLERLGGVYRQQGSWGPDPMNYPAGSASLIFSWASLSLLDVRNALSALPPLLGLLSALAICEPLARAASTPGRAGLVLVAGLGVTLAGLMFPVYQQFSHMEGTGRLLSIGSVALACLLLSDFVTGAQPERPAARALLLALVLFVLTTLNPVNLIPAAILVLAVAMAHGLWRLSAFWLVAAVPCGLLLLAMDPYYWALVKGTSTPARFVLESRLVELGFTDLASGWSTAVAGGWRPRLEAWSRLVPWHPVATFAVPLFAFATALVAGRADSRPAVGWTVVVVLASVGVLLATALLEPLAGDARFYLLPQYFPLAVAQYKGLLITALAAMIVLNADYRDRSAVWILVLVACTAALVAFTVRPVQPMHSAPRQSYCGSMGCVTPSDIVVVSELEAMVVDGRIPRIGDNLPRVLVPNHPVQAGPETWVFPTGGSRYLALSDALPIAFYYYQGDPDFTTQNYLEHVCAGLDRAWLERKRIRYVFLPEHRPDACPAAFGDLAEGDRIIVQSGNSMLIELAPVSP